jgi:acetate kinase
MTACHEDLPNVVNVACFDSGFHHTMPDYVKSYAIDPKIAKQKGLRKYGFHGLSYKYILRQVALELGKPEKETNIIALHLGSGASACAIRKGQSIDTSMGLTPVSGLPGGSRSGDIDPSLVFHYTSEASALSPNSTKDLHISTAEEILNKQSGWKALTGTSDFAEIAVPDAPDTHKLAFNIFVDRIVGFIGNYYVKLDGRVDALVFAGGIGEKSSYLRKVVTEKVSCLGFTIDDEKNKTATPDEDGVTDIGVSAKADKRTLVVETDEE